MRRVKLVPIIFLSVPVLFACGQQKPAPVIEYCTVYYHGNGGTVSANSAKIRKNVIFKDENTVNASKNGFAFLEWTFDQQGAETIPDDYKVTGDFEVYAQFRDSTLTMSNPDDGEIVCYGSTAVEYSNTLESNDDVTVTISPNVMDYEFAKVANRTWLILDAKDGNIEESVTITISNGIDSDYKTIFMHHPRSIQEAGEAVDFALGRGVYNITLTLNYDNQDDFDYFFDERVETRLSAPYYYPSYIQWSKGFNKTNRIYLAPSNKMATLSKDISQSPYREDFYYENLKNAAYELRHSKIQKRTDNHFAIDDVKKRLVVHNSETLFFALERGFRPEFVDSEIAVPNSVASRAYQVYQKAREACADAFGTETTDNLMKVRQLYEWLVDHTHYDHWITQEETPEEVEYFFEWSSYFPEGVFLNNGIAVCDGFAKSLAIMGGIEGLPIIRSAGSADVGGHAWNYYKHSDGKYYLICPTWSHDDNPADPDFIDYNYASISYQPFMAGSHYFYDSKYTYAFNYYEEKYPDVPEQTRIEAAESFAELYNFSDDLFSGVNKSSNPLTTNIYTTDVFDKTKGYDYDLNSDTEAKALGNALPIMTEDFCINLSYGSLDYLQSLWNVIKTRMSNVDSAQSFASYTRTECSFCVKF